jgi:peptide/nickel transport system permease protein
MTATSSQGSLAGFVGRRALAVLPILAGALVLTFVLMRVLPGDPAALLASGPGSGPEEVTALRHKLGLDRPLPEQLFFYMRDIAHGDLGRSFATGEPVVQDLLQRLPASLELTLAAFLLAVAVALPLGIAAALRPNSLVDHLCRLVATAGASLPAFVVGLGLIYVFYFRLGWSPEPVGRIDAWLVPPPAVTGLLLVDSLLAADGAAFVSGVRHLILPGVTMALFALAPLARITRGAMLGVLSADYIRTARALGLPRTTILLRYALHNALVPIITTLGMVFSYMLGANVLVEKVFAWPGIGSYSIDALMSADYAPVQGFVLAVAAIFAAVNLVTDILLGMVDPQVRRGG